MTSPTNWPQPTDPETYFRHQEKRVMNEQRRPVVRKASDILGPGFAPYANELIDWDSDEAAFNGYFWSDVGALNTPEGVPSGVGTKVWIGETLSSGDTGVQVVWRGDVTVNDTIKHTRRWARIAGVRVYGEWTPGPWRDVIYEAGWSGYGLPYGPFQYRKIEDILYFQGLAGAGPLASPSLITILPDGYRPIVDRLVSVNVSGVLGQVAVEPDGEMKIYYGGAKTYVLFDSISISLT